MIEELVVAVGKSTRRKNKGEWIMMKSLATIVLLFLGSIGTASAQMASITSILVQTTGCVMAPTLKPCDVGPGMTLEISGDNFGADAGNVSLCDCPNTQITYWTPTRIDVTVDEVTPKSIIIVETKGGDYSNGLAYTALPPVIQQIDVGTCSYVPNWSRKQCAITAGTRVTIRGSYFGRYAGEVGTCDCANAIVESWDPNWLTDPSTSDNTIVITAVDAVCGSSITVEVGGMTSNPVPYTTCAS
jgi:hypothetical protein